MLKLTKKELKKKRERIRTKAKELIKQMKEAQNAENWNLYENLDRELEILRRKQKHVLYRLGVRKYGENETVEYSPGQYMNANEYYWLIDD